MSALFIGKDCWVFISKFLVYYRDWNNLRCTSRQFRDWFDIKLALFLWGDEIYHPSFPDPTNFLKWVPTLKFYQNMSNGEIRMKEDTTYKRFICDYNKDVLVKWDSIKLSGLTMWNYGGFVQKDYPITITNWIVLKHHVFIISEQFNIHVTVFNKSGKLSEVNLGKEINKYALLGPKHYKENFLLVQAFQKTDSPNRNFPSISMIFKFESLSQDKFSIEKVELDSKEDESVFPFFTHQDVIGITDRNYAISFVRSDGKVLWKEDKSPAGKLLPFMYFQTPIIFAKAFAVGDDIVLITQWSGLMVIKKLVFTSPSKTAMKVKSQIEIKTLWFAYVGTREWNRNYISQRFGHQIFGMEKVTMEQKEARVNLFRFDLLRFEKHSYNVPNLSYPFPVAEDCTFHTTENGFKVGDFRFYFKTNKRFFKLTHLVRKPKPNDC